MENTTTADPRQNAAEGIFGTDLGLVKSGETQTNTVTQHVTEPVVTTPVVEPVVTTPASTTPITPTTELIFDDEPASTTPTFDETKYLTETFGTADKTVIKDRFTKYEQVNKELEEAALKLAQPKYNNKVAEVLDEILSKTGGDINSNKDFVKNTLDLLTTDETKLDALSLVKFNLRMQYPNMSQDLLDAHLEQEYMQGENYTEEQNKAGQAKLEMAAKSASLSLSELKTKAFTTDTTKQAALHKLQEEKRQQSWAEPIKKVVEDFKSLKLPIGKVGGKNAYVNFDIPADVAKGYQEMVYNSMIQTGGLPNEETVAIANNTLRALYIADNLEHITTHIWNKAQSEGIKKEIEQYHNPSTTGKQIRQEVAPTYNRDLEIAKSMGYRP